MEYTDFENVQILNFQGLMTLTLDQVTHIATIMHRAWGSTMTATNNDHDGHNHDGQTMMTNLVKFIQ